MRIKSAFFCSNCGTESPKWLGRCPVCGEWNTYVEEVIHRHSDSIEKKSSSHGAIHIDSIQNIEQPRIPTHYPEFDRVLGGGFVPGSIILIGGEPGIGKSTLLLQVALDMKQYKIMYVSGEESELQLHIRAERLQKNGSQCYIFTDSDLEEVFHQAEQLQPEILIIDSIQTLQTDVIDSPAGSISQVRECTAQLQKYAKTTNVPVVLIGHITKDGALAGPKVLEHIVDTVLQFEGDRNHGYRILRTMKNRFGSTNELGIFEMNANGLRQIINPAELLISQHPDDISGIAVATIIEGSRPMLAEVQALVATSTFGVPQRSSTGFDYRRMNMILAVLEKRLGFRFSNKDVFLNVAGGIRLDDTAADLAIAAALLSSSEDIPLPIHLCFAAEMGLSGEIRPVTRLDARIAEAQKAGFKKMIISRFALKNSYDKNKEIEIIPVDRMDEMIRYIFG
ncbi:MAG TPA: DNA repair protein RadA [Bacteroidales bacterium]|jgi:DNA repair protein RadA/Sms|nr:DNA repair protein RadA [Bacteroidales bacterium]MDI9573569.1 DNA repair protein RadA [Bacteroidota bacterium]MBP9511203.1 DNA repair protein RadA [Bacteroidales bacterium]MBP9587585.1 DNA repair protein RadA [Bacteroidales bacterium]NMD16876.1 DNA repair protein RadA [Bacteroidales bacterium]